VSFASTSIPLKKGVYDQSRRTRPTMSKHIPPAYEVNPACSSKNIGAQHGLTIKLIHMPQDSMIKLTR